MGSLTRRGVTTAMDAFAPEWRTTMNEYGAQDGQLWYPRLEEHPSTITVSLWDVRAADDLVIGYDFARDGWTIARGEAPDVEVAFVRSWADMGPGQLETGEI